MKKLILMAISIILLNASSTVAVGLQGNCYKQQQGEITVSASADKEFSPDTATITIAIETIAKTAKKAADENAKKAKSVIENSKIIKAENNKDKLKTTSYSVYPYKEWDGGQKKYIDRGFKAKHKIIFKTHQLNKIGTIADIAIKNGATRIENISFEITDDSLYYNELLESAVKKAKKRAEVISRTLGVKIKGIKQVNPDSYIRPYYSARKSARAFSMAESNTAPAPIEANDVKIEARVKIVFLIQ